MAKHDPRLDKIEKLKRLRDDAAATQGEKENAQRMIEALQSGLGTPLLRKTRRKRRMSERERLKRVKAGIQTPIWDDVNHDIRAALDELDKIPLSPEEMTFLGQIRLGVADDRRALYGSSLARMNDLLRRRFNFLIEGARA
jgi:hypothetical protein